MGLCVQTTVVPFDACVVLPRHLRLRGQWIEVNLHLTPNGTPLAILKYGLRSWQMGLAGSPAVPLIACSIETSSLPSGITCTGQGSQSHSCGELPT